MEYNLKYQNLEIVVNSKGAELEHIYCNGKDYMRSRDEYWNRKSPVLFPIVGKLRDLKTNIDGKTYNMNQHGFARDKEFELIEKGENKLVFSIEYNEETLKMFPYKFKLDIEYVIENNKLDVNYLVKNIDEKDIYFNIGGHPGFKLPIYENETFKDYSVVFECVETWNAPTVASNGTLNFKDTILYEGLDKIDLDYKYFEIDAIVIPGIKSRTVKLVNKENKGIEFSYYGFNTLAIWTKPNAPFVCLEPWKGYADHSDSDYDFKKKDDIVCLEKNDIYKAGFSVNILD